MARHAPKIWDTLLHQRSLRLWRRMARGAEAAELSTLQAQRRWARQLAAQLHQLIFVADSRLALPRVGSQTFARPGGTQWAWRPQLWRGPVNPRGVAGASNKTPIGNELTVFHDCDLSELTLRQVRNTREGDLAPFGLRMDVFGFDGSFLSLVLDFPPEAVAGMKKQHLIRLATVIEAEKGLELFARLNIKHGPNTEQVVLELPVNRDETVVEFDLAYSDLNDKRIEKMWLDLIFEGPQMNQITLRDLTFARYARATI